MKIEEAVSSMLNYTKGEFKKMSNNDFWAVNFADPTLFFCNHELQSHDLNSALREVRSKAHYHGYFKKYDRINFTLMQYNLSTAECVSYWDGYVTKQGVFIDLQF